MNKKIFQLPQLIAEGFLAQKKENTAFVVAGGRAPEVNWLKEAASDKEIYCADKGIEICLEADFIPKKLFGDGDSADNQLYWQASALGTQVLRFNPEKDATDLQLVLQNMEADIICSGVWGGRFDHLYSNVFSLLGYKVCHKAQVILADEKEVMLLLTAGESVQLKFTKTPQVLSLLPLSEASTVSLAGVKWELENSPLELLHPYAISNVPQAECSCICQNGAVGLYLYFNK